MFLSILSTGLTLIYVIAPTVLESVMTILSLLLFTLVCLKVLSLAHCCLCFLSMTLAPSVRLLALNSFCLLMILHPLQSFSDLSLIQSDLNSITSWLSLNLLSVNPAKSKYMIFALKSQQCFDYLPPLQLNNLFIARVFTFQYLGILLSCNMSWTSHISSISKRLSIFLV